jgi:hypothetical protein
MHWDPTNFPVPEHSALVNIKNGLAAVCQKRAATFTPSQAQQNNQRRWQAKTPVKARVDDRFNLLLSSRGTPDRQE